MALRLYTVSSMEVKVHFRVLLLYVKGFKSFAGSCGLDGVQCGVFGDSCEM